MPSYFIDLLYDKNAEIQKLADQALDLIMVYFILFITKMISLYKIGANFIPGF